MADEMYFLTEQDARTMKEMVAWWIANKDRIEQMLAQQETKEQNLVRVNEAAKRGFRGP